MMTHRVRRCEIVMTSSMSTGCLTLRRETRCATPHRGTVIKGVRPRTKATRHCSLSPSTVTPVDLERSRGATTIRAGRITGLVALRRVQGCPFRPGPRFLLEPLDVLIKLSAIHARHSAAPELDRREFARSHKGINLGDAGAHIGRNVFELEYQIRVILRNLVASHDAASHPICIS